MSKVGLFIPCDVCGQRERVVAQDALGVDKVGYDLACGHRAGWKPDQPARDFSVTVHYLSDLIRCRIKADQIDGAIGRQILEEVRSAVIQGELGRLLLEYEIARPVSEEISFELMKELIRILPGMRIAFVNSDAKQMPAMKLATHVSHDRGEEHSYFADSADAEAWLLSDCLVAA